jgi:hypothetical protein
MKVFYFIIAFFATCPSFLFSKEKLPHLPKRAANLETFVPIGWTKFTETEGDLNGDKIPDKVLIIEALKNNRSKRILVILFRSNKFWTLAGSSSEVILDSKEGGLTGDPFSGISIRNGILVIEHQGGTKLIWKYAHSYQHKKDGFYLIAKKHIEIDSHSKKTKEITTNYLTRKSIHKETDIDGKILPTKTKNLKHMVLKKM